MDAEEKTQLAPLTSYKAPTMEAKTDWLLTAFVLVIIAAAMTAIIYLGVQFW